MSKLVFKIGEETRPTILSHEEFDASPFSDQLKAAKKRMSELLNKWNDRRVRATIGKTIPGQNSFGEPVDNNIIAFLGERGSGKTSCLYSIKEIFPNCKDTQGLADDTEFLHVIDPSFFDEHHNILEIFIGELYHEYEKIARRWEKMPQEERLEVKKLHGLFAKVRQSIKFLSAQRLELPEDQEGLSALSEGVNLQLLVSKLVDAYLVCKKKKYLVVPIDDIDLNIREAYRMMEQIRKYLVVPNVVVLMAAKLSQLRNSIVLKLAEYYKAIKDSGIEMHRIQTMADRYLDKFIPLERRIHMPVLTDYSSAELEIVNRGEIAASAENQYESVEFAVLSLIYKKCGYLFYNYEETPSLIIPETLRELRSFVTMLFEMEDRDTPETHHRNKCAFKEYFHTQWLQRLPSDQQAIAETILKEKNATKINKSVVALLHGYAKTLGLANQSEHNEASSLSQIRLKEILNPENYSENISIGDVMAVLEDLNNVAASSRIDYLIFFVTTYYSMKLYEEYDSMTDTLDSAVHKQLKNKSKFPSLKSSRDYTIPNYFEIVGNSFFTLTGESFIPASSNRSYSRELSLMNGALLFETIEEIIKEYESDNSIISDPKFILRFNLVEFFMLCASRKIESKDGYYSPFRESKWRANSSDFYFNAFDSNTKNILFDITAPFVNLGFIPLVYQRFSRKINDIAEGCPKSFYASLYKDKRSPKLPAVHDLLSRTAIRNAEVLKDLNLWLIKKKEKFNDNRDNDLIILRKFFENIGSYSVRTYELNKGTDDYHTINFTPFKFLTDFLNTLVLEYKKDADFEKCRKEQEKLFMRIYRKENLLAADTLYSLGELLRILRESEESDIPAKDTVISRIMKKTGQRIMSNLLVEYLAQYNIVEKQLFSYYFDDRLFYQYRNLVFDNMDKYRGSLNIKLKDSDDQRSALSVELSSIENEREKTQRRLVAIKKRIDQSTQAEKSTEETIKELSKEIEEIRNMIQTVQNQISESERKHRVLRDKYRKFSARLDNLREEMRQKEKELYVVASDRAKESLIKSLGEIRVNFAATDGNVQVVDEQMKAKSTEIDELKTKLNTLQEGEKLKESELNDRNQHLQNIQNAIHQDQYLFDSLLPDASRLKQRHADIISAIESQEKSNEALKREYEAFMRRRAYVNDHLRNFTR